MWNIEPNLRVGPLVLGMTTNMVVANLGEEYDTFKRVPDAADTIYAYDATGVHLTCDRHGVVKVISVFRPNVVSYVGVQLLGRPAVDVVNELNTKGVVADKAEAGYWVGQGGILMVEVEGDVDGIELYPA